MKIENKSFCLVFFQLQAEQCHCPGRLDMLCYSEYIVKHDSMSSMIYVLQVSQATRKILLTLFSVHSLQLWCTCIEVLK